MLQLRVRTEGTTLVFVDPDGDEHVCDHPEDVWGLLQDLCGQVQEKAQALAVPSSRRQARRERAKAARAAQGAPEPKQGDASLARREKAQVAKPQPAPRRQARPPEPESEPVDPLDRFVGRLGAAIFTKSGEVSSTSKWGRGGRQSRPKGT